MACQALHGRDIDARVEQVTGECASQVV